MNIGRYEFEGPYTSTNNLENRSGLYAIICQANESYLIDVGESATVKDRVETHDRKECWNRKNRELQGNLAVAVLYTPNLQSSGRVAIEQELRNQFHNLCGER